MKLSQDPQAYYRALARLDELVRSRVNALPYSAAGNQESRLRQVVRSFQATVAQVGAEVRTQVDAGRFDLAVKLMSQLRTGVEGWLEQIDGLVGRLPAFRRWLDETPAGEAFLDAADDFVDAAAELGADAGGGLIDLIKKAVIALVVVAALAIGVPPLARALSSGGSK